MAYVVCLSTCRNSPNAFLYELFLNVYDLRILRVNIPPFFLENIFSVITLFDKPDLTPLNQSLDYLREHMQHENELLKAEQAAYVQEMQREFNEQLKACEEKLHVEFRNQLVEFWLFLSSDLNLPFLCTVSINFHVF